MKITRISVWQMDLPLIEPYWLSGGRLRFESLDSTFVRLETDAGLTGWGEACPWGHTYLPAHGGGVRASIEQLAPTLIGQDPCTPDALNRTMDVTLPGHAYAKSALDIACWDILGKKAEMPLWRLLGGAAGASVSVNSSISTGSPEDMVAHMEVARAKGYSTHSAKIGGSEPSFDIARIEAIEAFRLPDEKITYDVNRAWTPATAIQVMNSVSTNAWFEQPCDTLDQCLLVRNRTRQPIMLDECLHSFRDHLEAWRHGACEGVKVKPNRLGGLTKSKLVRDFGVSVGWSMHIEEVGGTVLADTAALHLALSTAHENRLASWLCHPHLVDDYALGDGARNDVGKVTLTDKPGIGVEPPLDWLGTPCATYGAASS